MTAKFPVATLAQSDMGGPMAGIPFNEWTANGATTAGAATPFSLVVNEAIDTSVPAAGDLTTANGEVLHYSSYNAGTKTFTIDARAQQGTTAAAIDNASAIGHWLTRDQWNQLVADVIAMQAQDSAGADIASAGTTDLSTATGGYVHITGTTGITAFGTLPAGRVRILKFDGAVTITHNGTSLILQGAANLTTAAGDVVAFISEGSGNWRELFRRLATVSTSSPTANSAIVTTAETTVSTTFTDLATSGPAVTITTGTKALVILTGYLSSDTGNDGAAMGFAVSGATTIAATNLDALQYRASAAGAESQCSIVIPVTLNAGSNTFTAKYRAVIGGTATFQQRRIIVMPVS